MSRRTSVGRVADRADYGKWFAVAACSAGFFISVIHRISPGVFAAELMRDFNTSASIMGLLSSSYFYTYAILQIPVGLLCDKYRPGIVTTYFLLLGAFGAAVFAASTNLAMAVVGRVLLSAGVSAVFIAGIRIFGYAFEAGGFSTATGVLMAVGNIGGIAAQAPLAWAVLRFGWRASMYAVALLTLVVAAAVAFSTGKYKRRERGGGISQNERVAGFSTSVGRKEYLIMLYGLSIAIFLQYGSQMGYHGLWGVPFLTDVYGQTKAAASNVVMFASIGAMIGSPLTGWLVDKARISVQKLSIWSAAIFLVSWIPIAFEVGSGSLFPIIVGSFFLGGGSVMTAIINPTYGNLFIDEGSRGKFMGVLNSASMWGGAFFQPVMGMIIDVSAKNGSGAMTGYYSSFRLGLVAAVMVLAIRIAMYRRYKGLDRR